MSLVKKALIVLYLSAFLLSASDGLTAQFYQGKTVTVIQGRSAGGLGDVRVRTLVPYLQKYLPGNPQVVFEFMAGGGGIQAANHMAKVARRDGFTIANIASSIFAKALFEDPGVRYKLSDFVFLGAPSTGGPYGLVVRPSGPDTVEKLRTHKGLRIAERSVGHTMYNISRLIAFVLELPEPKWVVGYASGEIDFALERGEADAQSEVLYDFMKNKSQWLKNGFTLPIVLKNIKGRGPEAVPGFPKGTPTVDQYADTELKKEVLRLYYNSRPGGSVYFAPRGTPEPALEALRDAFNKIWSDPQFAKDYERMTAEPAEPLTGEEIERFFQQVPKDPKVETVMQQLIGAGPLPPRR